MARHMAKEGSLLRTWRDRLASLLKTALIAYTVFCAIAVLAFLGLIGYSNLTGGIQFDDNPIGRDTVEHWGDGKYQILGRGTYSLACGDGIVMENVVGFRESGDYVYVMGQVENVVIDLANHTYHHYIAFRGMEEQHRIAFEQVEEFTFLVKNRIP